MMAPKIVSVLGSALLVIGCAPSKPAATTPSTAASQSANGAQTGELGVLVMAHGGGPAWNEAVLDAVKPLRARYDVEIAFGMADAHSLQDSVKKLESRGARRIGVVRLFVSGESFLDRTEQILGLRPGAPAAPAADAHAGHAGHGDHHAGHASPGEAKPGDGKPKGGHGGHSMATYRLASASSYALSQHGLLDAEGMGTVLADRAAALSKTPVQEDVLILAHGPGDDEENARWIAKLDARAAVVRARAPFRRVQVETLREDWPAKRVEAEARIRAFVQRASTEGGKAIVIPFRVAGFGPYAKVLEGLDYVADQQGLIPHTEITRWLEQEIAALEAGPFRPTLPAP